MEDADKIFQAIDADGGHFYVCGDVKMAHDVTTKLEQIIAQKRDLTPEQAKHYVVKMRVSPPSPSARIQSQKPLR